MKSSLSARRFRRHHISRREFLRLSASAGTTLALWSLSACEPSVTTPGASPVAIPSAPRTVVNFAVVRPSLGCPRIMERLQAAEFEITVAGMSPEVPGLSACGQPPTAAEIYDLADRAGAALRLVPSGVLIPLRFLRAGDLRVYDRWSPFAGLDQALFEAGLPVSSEGLNLAMEAQMLSGSATGAGTVAVLSDDLSDDLVQFPIPCTPEEYQYAAGFRWECPLVVGADLASLPQTDRPLLADLELGSWTSPHAVCLTPGPPGAGGLRLAHLTDLHVAGRNDLIADILFPPGRSDEAERARFLERYLNPNDNLRRLIRHLNRRAEQGELDLVVATGDLVDYGYDTPWMLPQRAQDSNLARFIEIVTGADGRGEPLGVPMYTTPGNHEYVRPQTPLSITVDPEIKDTDEWSTLKWAALLCLVGYDECIRQVSAYYEVNWKKFRGQGLEEGEARQVDETYGVPRKVGAALALAKMRPRAGLLAEYVARLAYDVDNLVALGPHQLVLLNTGEDVGYPASKKVFQDSKKWKGEDLFRYKHLLNFLNEEPDARGIYDAQIRLLGAALQAAGQGGGRTLVFSHAPLLNLRTSGGSAADYLLLDEARHEASAATPNMITAWLGWLENLVLRYGTDEECARNECVPIDIKSKPLMLQLQDLVEGAGGTIYPNMQGYEHIDWWDPAELSHPNWVAVTDSGSWQFDGALAKASWYLQRQGFPQAGTPHFKEGSREMGLDHGVAANDALAHEMLSLSTGSQGDSPVDLFLAGHTHNVHEFRVAQGARVAGSLPFGFAWEKNDTQHIFYRSADEHVHEVAFRAGSGWYHNDITQRTGAPRVSVGPAGFAWEGNGSIHVIYQGVDSHVHELGYSRQSGWYNTNLTKEASAKIDIVGEPFGFAWEGGGSIHVIYQSEDGHLHELSYSHSQGWRHADLTYDAAAPLSIGLPRGYAWEGNGSIHVIYLGLDWHIHELSNQAGLGWSHRDLTLSTGGPLAGGRPAGFAWESDNTQHVFYCAQDGQVCEFWFTPDAGWHAYDPGREAGAPAANGDPTAYAWEGAGSQHVVYQGTDGHLHQLSWSPSTGWRHTDLIQATGVPMPRPMPQQAPASYVWEGNQSQHVVYWGEDDVLHELYRSVGGEWQHTDLTQAADLPDNLRFYAGDYSHAAWEDAKRPILVTSGAGKSRQPAFRELCIEGDTIAAVGMQRLRPTCTGLKDGLVQTVYCSRTDKLFQSFENPKWPNKWGIIVGGDFGGGEQRDLLLYSPITGEAELYTIADSGEPQPMAQHQGWRKSWSHILAGNFGGSGRDGLFLYDAETGESEFWAVLSYADLRLLRRHQAWPKTWSHIVANDLDHDGRTDLLFYDASAGVAEIQIPDGQGGLRLHQRLEGWRKTWSHVVAAAAPGAILLYDRMHGEAELHITSRSTADKPLFRYGGQDGLSHAWTHIVPGDFGGGGAYKDLLAYDSVSGEAQFCELAAATALMRTTQSYTNWRRGWSVIVPCRFGGGALTNLLFYDSNG